MFSIIAINIFIVFSIIGSYSEKKIVKIEKKNIEFKKIHRQFPHISKAIIEVSIEEKIDPRLTAAIIAHESKGNIKARGKVGEVGIMQIRPYHFKNQKLEVMRNPRVNIKTGLKVLKDCIRHEGNTQRALSCYNGGPHRKVKRIKKYENEIKKNYLSLK